MLLFIYLYIVIFISRRFKEKVRKIVGIFVVNINISRIRNRTGDYMGAVLMGFVGLYLILGVLSYIISKG